MIWALNRDTHITAQISPLLLKYINYQRSVAISNDDEHDILRGEQLLLLTNVAMQCIFLGGRGASGKRVMIEVVHFLPDPVSSENISMSKKKKT